MATRCCWPPESWPGRWWPRSPSPTRSSSSVALAPATRRELPASRIGATTLPWAVRLGIRLKAWKTTPTVSRRCAVRSRPDSREVSRPSSLIDPAVGVRSPARQERRVVFPQPDGPRRTTSSPSSASKVSPSKGRTTYPPEVNSTVRSRTSSAAHWAAAKALDGSTEIALRSATRLDSSPDGDRDGGKHQERAGGDLDREREHRLEELGRHHGEGGREQGDGHRLRRHAEEEEAGGGAQRLQDREVAQPFER